MQLEDGEGRAGAEQVLDVSEAQLTSLRSEAAKLSGQVSRALCLGRKAHCINAHLRLGSQPANCMGLAPRV